MTSKYPQQWFLSGCCPGTILSDLLRAEEIAQQVGCLTCLHRTRFIPGHRLCSLWAFPGVIPHHCQMCPCSCQKRTIKELNLFLLATKDFDQVNLQKQNVFVVFLLASNLVSAVAMFHSCHHGLENCYQRPDSNQGLRLLPMVSTCNKVDWACLWYQFWLTNSPVRLFEFSVKLFDDLHQLH